MKYKLKYSFFFVGFLSIYSVCDFAANCPDKCPGFAAIKSVSIENIEAPNGAFRGWVGTVTNQFNTNVTWELMGILWNNNNANNENEAREKINSRIQLIDYVDGPIEFANNCKCIYMNQPDGEVAIADTKILIK